jgi:arylsulfatase A-like enzyme
MPHAAWVSSYYRKRMITRRSFLGAAAGVAVLAQVPKRPNILLISCENLGGHLGCYGDGTVRTPSIDEFAASATRFDRAYANSGVGAVSRSAIQTGMYPVTLGTHLDGRATLPPFVKPFTEYLRQAGYWIPGGKAKSVRPAGAPSFVWKRLDAVNPSRVRLRDAAYERLIRPVKAAERLGTTELTYPPHFEDGEESRRDWQNYHELVSLLDRQFALAAKGVDDNTVVVFFSEYGFTLREGNSAAYESGTRVPLLVKLPGTVKGSVSTRMVMLMDLGPSLLNLAGVKVPGHMQGQAFLGEHLPPQRRTVYASLDRADFRYQTVRSLRDSRYRFVCNYTVGAEELYDTAADPNEVKNLAASDPSAVSRFRDQLDRWRTDTRDLGLIPEPELAAKEAIVGTRWAVGRQQGFDRLQQRMVDVAMTQSFDRVRQAFADEDASVRTLACARPDPKLQADWRRALGDPSGAVRVRAAWSLRKQSQSDKAALKVLLKDLASQEEWLRFYAATALEELGDSDPAVPPALRAAAATEKNRSTALVLARILKGTPPHP